MASTLPNSMTAIEIAAPGGPEVLRPASRPVPQPGAGEVLIRVAAAGVNRPDVLQRKGGYPPPPGASDLPGLEIAGEVVALGEGVDQQVGGQSQPLSLGQEVCALVTGGGYAEYCVAPAPQVLPIPKGFSMVEAAAGPLLQAVDEGGVDVAVTVRPEPDARLRYQHVLDDPFVLLCRRDDPLARQRSVSWRVFADRPFIAAFPQSSIRPVTDAVFLQQGLQVHARLTYPSIAAAGALVQTGLGITALPRMALRLVTSDGLVALPLQRPAMHRPIGLVTRIGRTLSPVAQAFVPLLARALKEAQRGEALRRARA